MDGIRSDLIQIVTSQVKITLKMDEIDTVVLPETSQKFN